MLRMGKLVDASGVPQLIRIRNMSAGGVMASTQAHDFSTQPIYYAVSTFLALSACFYAALIAEDPRRLDTIVSAWIFAAVFTTALGVMPA